MTKELKQAAQQALEALRNEWSLRNGYTHNAGGRIVSTAEDAIASLERALTQRPAAQEVTVRVHKDSEGRANVSIVAGPLAFDCTTNQDGRVSWAYECGHDRKHGYGRVDWPAPQQATPEQEPNPLAARCYTMSEPHLSGYRLVLGFETLEAVDAAHTWVANIRKGTRQATPEPVGEHDMAGMLERGAKAWAGVDPQDLRAGGVAHGPVGEPERHLEVASLQAVCRYISDTLAGDASPSEKHIARTIMHLLPLDEFVAVPQGQEPAAWFVSLPDEPELGKWFSEQDMSEQGYTSKPLYTRPAPGVPEVTEAMLVAGLKECEPLGELIDWREDFGRDEMRAVWDAMLAAARTTHKDSA